MSEPNPSPKPFSPFWLLLLLPVGLLVGKLIGGMPAAQLGTMGICVGPPCNVIKGSATVMVGGMPAARMGDSTSHGGVITLGCPTVLIGG